MGIIIRLPFYLIGLYLWTIAGGLISLVNLLSLPIFGLASAIAPSLFPPNAKDILTFGILRRGYSKLTNFLKYGI